MQLLQLRHTHLLFSEPKNASSTVIKFRCRSIVLSNIKCKRLTVLSSSAVVAVPALERPGSKMVVELVGAFNELTERMKVSNSNSSMLLFKALKLSISLLHALPLLPDGRSPLSKSLSVAIILADLQMDAEVICAGLLRDAIEQSATSLYEIREHIGSGTAHLLHENMRLKNISSKVESLDDESASALRKFCLTYYDVRAIILELAIKLDMMRHLENLPRYKQQKVSLEVMKIYAPLAHALATNVLSLELEDLSFQYLFPHSYIYIEKWLISHKNGSRPLIEIYKDQLLQSLKSDSSLLDMVDDISVEGRYKSNYSTMKKLLRDGRKPEEVNDILGLRVILTQVSGEVGEKACYRARDIIQSLWKEMPSRSKDYIKKPKNNGYKSLHMAVDISDTGRKRPLMEIQIRTAEMDMLAAGGTASHALYKGGLTDPEESKHLKAIMMAAVELAALRLKDFPSASYTKMEIGHGYPAFQLLDKNGDGKISIEELMDVMEELGALGEDAREMMQLIDSNNDGSLSSEEFDFFQKQVEFMQNVEDKDVQCKTFLNQKLQVECNNERIQL